MSLRNSLLGLVLGATLLPALLIGWRFLRESDAQVAIAMQDLTATANNVAIDLQHRVQGTAQLHFGLTHAHTLYSADQAECSAFLSKVREAYPQYTGIVTVLPDGRLHCDSLQTGRVLDLSDRWYVRRALAGATGLMLEPVFGRLTGNAVLQIVLPARTDDGRLRFLLVASLNLQKFADEARKSSLPGELEVMLVDVSGTVMARSGTALSQQVPGGSMASTTLFSRAQAYEAGGTSVLVSPAGQSQVWAVAAASGANSTGLRVLVGRPLQALVAESDLRLQQELTVLAGVALLLFASVWSLAEWGIRRQVERVTAMVSDLGTGNLSARLRQPYPRGELGGLMAALNGAAGSLQLQREENDGLQHALSDAHAREIATREKNETRLSHVANFDGLTGLPNRSLFHDRLQQAIVRARRSGSIFALMLLDIDRFKVINDSLGHDIGDRLLVAVSRVLLACARNTDSISLRGTDQSREGVFRLGGDEFTILLEQASEAASVAIIAQRFLSALSEPLMIDEHELFISASIGITLFTDDGTDLDGLIKQADLAMYRAKALGRDTFFFFDEELNREASRRHLLEGKLRHALERHEFLLHYQPTANLETGRIEGVEALLRWQPSGEALVGPDEFIAILEETGLIVPVGTWVFRTACEQMMVWQRQGMPQINLAVNLSARQFRHSDLISDIALILAETGFDANRLELELTESMLIDNSAAVLSILKGLSRMGVKIAIDDFGTGHSSLSYLKRFNVDTLKIDRSFIKDVSSHPEDNAIAIAIIALGHGLGLRVVAEGVETQAQVEFLRALGCDEMQGYHLSRPIDGVEFSRWFALNACSSVAQV